MSQYDAPLKKARTTWGNAIVNHYKWASMNLGFCKAIGAAANGSTWSDCVIKLNQFILVRALKGRVKNSLNPIEKVDLVDLKNWIGNGTFSKISKSGKPLATFEYKSIYEAELPTGYSFDQFGLIVQSAYGYTNNTQFVPTQQSCISLDQQSDRVNAAYQSGLSVPELTTPIPSINSLVQIDGCSSRDLGLIIAGRGGIVNAGKTTQFEAQQDNFCPQRPARFDQFLTASLRHPSNTSIETRCPPRKRRRSLPELDERLSRAFELETQKAFKQSITAKDCSLVRIPAETSLPGIEKHREPYQNQLHSAQWTSTRLQESDSTCLHCESSKSGSLSKYSTGRDLLAATLREIISTLPTIQATGKLCNWVADIKALFAVFDLDVSRIDIPEIPQCLCTINVSSHQGWISCTVNELDRFIETGASLPDHILAIRVVDCQNECEDIEAAFLQWMENDVKLQYQNWNRRTENSPTTKTMGKFQFLERYRVRRTVEARSGLDDFRNFLSISGSALEIEVPEPPFIRKLGYNLLTMLKKKLWNNVQVEHGAHGQKETSMRISDCESCLRFVLYGECYSFSDWHIDVLTGTWVTFITGWKAWFIYVGPWNDDVRENLYRGQFVPSAEHVQMILLGSRDSLFMRPGLPTPVLHCVLTFDDSLAAGGMVWPFRNIDKTMENLDFVMRNPNWTNEKIPRQLPEYLDATIQFMNRRRPPNLKSDFLQLMARPYFKDYEKKTVQDLIKTWKTSRLLSCLCKKCSPVNCPCLDAAKSVHRGCTVWCKCEC